MIIPINRCDEFGIITDRPGYSLPLNAWTGGNNVHFQDGYVKRSLGHITAFGTPSVIPHFLLPVTTSSNNFWLYAGAAKVFAVDASTIHTNITRQSGGTDVDYHASADSRWTGGVLGGIPVLANPQDDPQTWDTSAASNLVSLPYVTGTSTWESLGYRCKSLRPFRNYLVALDITVGAERFPHMVKWSHPAVPGELPTSWDPEDPTKDAGEFSLAQTNGWVLDSVPLRDATIIYKEDSIWGMQYVAGISIFRFYQIFRELGMIAINCAVEYASGKHALFGLGDITIHDGQSMQSIVTQKVRRTIFSRIDTTNLNTCFVAKNNKTREIWFCYPTTGASVPNEAMLWNWETQAIGFRELPNTRFGETGLIFTQDVPDTWESDTESWDSDVTKWGDRNFSVTETDLLLASDNTKLYKVAGETFDGQPYSSYIERTGLGIPAPRSGEPPDLASVKFLRAIYPHITGPDGGVVNVHIGTQTSIDGAIKWNGPYPYVINKTKHLDVRLRGTLFSVRFSTTDTVPWQLSGYELDMTVLGQR